MELTPEEKQKIYEEEKARLEAKQQVLAEQLKDIKIDKPNKNQNYIGCLAIIGFIIIVTIIICLVDKAPSRPTSSIRIGSEAKLYQSEGHQIPAAIDYDIYEEMVNEAAAHDTIGWQQLILEGKLFVIDNDTKVLVLDSKGFALKVRILEGEYLGQVAWVSLDAVKGK